MKYTEYISNKSILEIIQRVFNYADPRLMDHGLRVSYLVWRMLHPLKIYQDEDLRDICFLAILHDIGAYKTSEINQMLDYETDNIWEHSIYGYLFLRYFSPLKDKSCVVLMHHVPWRVIGEQKELDDTIREMVGVLYLADRIDVSLNVKHRTWEETRRDFTSHRGTRFSPRAVDLAQNLAIDRPLMELIMADEQFFCSLSAFLLTQAQITDYLKMIIFSIDFRSRHTVTHTITTTSISYELARLMGLDEDTCNRIVCGALLHDVGKVGIPVEILEFPGRLSPRAMAIMQTHVDIGKQIFGGSIEESTARIALRHHEKLDGSGYPRGLKAEDLTLPERIVAIADIVSALSGTRSYKDAFDKERIFSILTQMRRDGLLDPDIIDKALVHYDSIMEHTQALCDPLISIYFDIQTEFRQLIHASSPARMIHMAWENAQGDDGLRSAALLFPGK